MLLTQAIEKQQELYVSIQNEIEALLEKQRQIQVYLQQLGTVESQMVSAVALLTEAIASIKEVCPDEIENYKATVTNLFNEVKLLPSPSPEPSPETETKTEPSPETKLIKKIITYSKLLPWPAYKKFVSSHLKIDAKATRSEISAIFEGYLVSQDIEILRGIIANIKEA